MSATEKRSIEEYIIFYLFSSVYCIFVTIKVDLSKKKNIRSCYSVICFINVHIRLSFLNILRHSFFYIDITYILMLFSLINIFISLFFSLRILTLHFLLRTFLLYWLYIFFKRLHQCTYAFAYLNIICIFSHTMMA